MTDKEASQISKKICIAANRYPPDYSGAGKRAQELRDYLASSGHQVCVITTRPTEGKSQVHQNISYYRRWGRAERQGGGPNRRNSLVQKMILRFNRAFETGGLLYLLLKHRKDFQYLFLYGKPCFPGAVMKLCGKRIIYRPCIFGGDDHLSLVQAKGAKLKNRLLLRLVDFHWCISKQFLEAAYEVVTNKDKVIFIPNGVLLHSENGKLLRKWETVEDSAIENPRFIFVGSIDYRKGSDHLAVLFPLILKNHPDAKLTLCGPIIDHGIYNDIAAIPNVDYIGTVDNVDQILQRNHFFLFPSRQEGFPTALVEAMAHGLVCLVSVSSGFHQDIIQNGENGLSVDFEIPESAADDISPLISCPGEGKRVSQNAMKTVAERYNRPMLFQKLVNAVLLKSLN